MFADGGVLGRGARCRQQVGHFRPDLPTRTVHAGRGPQRDVPHGI